MTVPNVENICSKCLLGFVAILNLWQKSGLERSSPSQSDSKHTSLTLYKFVKLKHQKYRKIVCFE